MEFTDYQKYTSQTVAGYPKKWRNQLIKIFLDEQIACVGSQLTLTPRIELLWKGKNKARENHVKITFDYCQKGYNLIQHYYKGTLVGMERMDHVVNFICKAWADSPKE